MKIETVKAVTPVPRRLRLRWWWMRRRMKPLQRELLDEDSRAAERAFLYGRDEEWPTDDPLTQNAALDSDVDVALRLLTRRMHDGDGWLYDRERARGADLIDEARWIFQRLANERERRACGSDGRQVFAGWVLGNQEREIDS